MKYVYLILIIISGCFAILLPACSSQDIIEYSKDVALSEVSGNKMSRNPAACPSIKAKCHKRKGEYVEWEQDNGKKACACNT